MTNTSGMGGSTSGPPSTDDTRPARLPGWIAAADVATVALLAIAGAIVWSGGYRGEVAGVFVSLRSPARALVLALVLAAIRHAAVRRPSLPERILGIGPALARFLARVIVGPRMLRHELVLVGALMAGLTVLMTWPQVRQLDATPEHADPIFSMWRLGWVAHQLIRDPLRLYDANIYWPERNSLANSDGMPLTGVAAAPLVWSGVPLSVVYNVLLLASFVLTGMTMYALVRTLVGRALPAVVSAVAFAFYPWRFEHYVHLELLSTFWMPLALLVLHRTLDGPHRWRMGLLLGVVLAAQYLSSMYFGVYLACYLAVAGGWLALSGRRLAVAAAPLAVAAVVTVVLIAPSVPPYLHIRESTGERTSDELDRFSARPADYVAVVQPDRPPREVNERQVFPGRLIVVLALIALWPPFTAVRLAYLAGLVLAFDLSLGSHGVLYPMLYEWALPFRGLRAAGRAAILVGFSLAVLAGFGAARLSSAVSRRGWAVAVTTVVCGILLFETRPALALRPVPSVPEVYDWFRGRTPAPIVELPVWYTIGYRYMLNSTTHWFPLVNGFSGSLPASYPPIHRAMQTFPTEESLAMLRDRGVVWVVVHEELYGTEDYTRLIEAIAAWPELPLVHQDTTAGFESRIYALRPARDRSAPEAPLGR